MWIGEYGKFVYLTYMGTVLAISAIYFMLQQQPTEAMMCFIGSGMCDLFDGQVARSFERTEFQEGYGTEIDSLCDMVSFAVLPAVLLLKAAIALSVGIVGVLLASLYVVAAVSRLAYFNTLAKDNSVPKPTHFTGLPVTYAALVFPVVYLISEWFKVGSYVYAWLLFGLVLSFLFVWHKPIPKPNSKAYLFFVGLAIVTLLGLWRL